MFSYDGNVHLQSYFSENLTGCVSENAASQGAWVTQSVKHPTLDLGSGHDLTVCEFEPCVRHRADSVKPAWDSLSLPSLLSFSFSFSFLFLSLSLSK